MSGQDGVTLTPGEVAVVATVLIRDRLDDCGEWASWDLVPELDEDSYHAVLGVIQAAWHDEVRRLEGKDSTDLMERIS